MKIGWGCLLFSMSSLSSSLSCLSTAFPAYGLSDISCCTPLALSYWCSSLLLKSCLRAENIKKETEKYHATSLLPPYLHTLYWIKLKILCLLRVQLKCLHKVYPWPHYMPSTMLSHCSFISAEHNMVGWWTLYKHCQLGHSFIQYKPYRKMLIFKSVT